MRQYLHEILFLLGERRRKLPLLGLSFIGVSLLELIGIGLIGPYVAVVINPRLVGGLTGSVLQFAGIPTNRETALIVLGALLVTMFALKAVAAITLHGAIVRFAQYEQARYQSRLMNAYQNLSYSEFMQRNSSEYVHAIEVLCADFAYMVQTVLRGASEAVVVVVILGLLMWHNPAALAVLAILLALPIYGYDRFFRKNLRRFGAQANDAATTVVRGVHEGIGGLKEIRILGKESYFHSMVRRGANDYARARVRGHVITLAPRYLLELAMVSFLVALVLFFLLSGRGLEPLIPTLAVFGVAAVRFVPAVNTLSVCLTELRLGRDSVSRLYRDVKAISEPSFASPQLVSSENTQPFQELRVDRVRFMYAGVTRRAIDDLTLVVRAGESVGLIGPSGSGKTTLVDILLGLLEPQSGEVRYNDRPLDSDTLAEWRGKVAYLPQEAFLIDDSVRRNVALGVDDADVDEDRLISALEQARLSEVVATMPHGMDTLVGERGVRLSGGQRQRVAIARAFYHRREVLVMDEATSALDIDAEHEIVDQIRRLRGKITLVVIAHRPSTVRYCDRIVRLGDGRITDTSADVDVVIDGHAPTPGSARWMRGSSR